MFSNKKLPHTLFGLIVVTSIIVLLSGPSVSTKKDIKPSMEEIEKINECIASTKVTDDYYINGVVKTCRDMILGI